MHYDDDITVKDLLLNNRPAKSVCEIPADIHGPDTRQIRDALRHHPVKTGNTGFWKRLAAIVLEPANPFNAKAPRRFRQEAVVLGTLFLFATFLVILFNLFAIAR